MIAYRQSICKRVKRSDPLNFEELQVGDVLEMLSV